MELSNVDVTKNVEAYKQVATKKLKTIDFVIGLQISRGGLDSKRAQEVTLYISSLISEITDLQYKDLDSTLQYVNRHLAGLNLEAALESYLSYEIKNIFKSQFLPPQVN